MEKYIVEELEDQYQLDIDGLSNNLEDLSERPKKRCDCEKGPRPCPWVSCKYNLMLDVLEDGSIRYNSKIANWKDEPFEVEESCALDVADKANSIEHLCEIMGSPYYVIDYIYETAIAKLREGFGLDKNGKEE